MWYWILLALLIIGSVSMVAGVFIRIKKNKLSEAGMRQGRGRRRDAEYDEDVLDAEESAGMPQGRRRARPVRAEEQVQRPRKKKRRQWKIILEDIDSWKKYSFIFYDTVGIGRGREGSLYEKYLPLPEDGRISKVHCAIIHRGDKLYLKDEGSRNGTYLNGVLIDQPVVIQKDDVIGIGETHLEVLKVLRESE